MTTIKQHLNLPTSAQNVKAYYTGEMSYRAAVVKFQISATTFRAFLLTTCFKELNNLSSKGNPFKNGGSNIPLPDWWEGAGNELAVGGECDDKGVGYEMSVSPVGDIFTLYMRLTIP